MATQNFVKTSKCPSVAWIKMKKTSSFLRIKLGVIDSLLFLCANSLESENVGCPAVRLDLRNVKL